MTMFCPVCGLPVSVSAGMAWVCPACDAYGTQQEALTEQPMIAAAVEDLQTILQNYRNTCRAEMITEARVNTGELPKSMLLLSQNGIRDIQQLITQLFVEIINPIGA